MFEWFQRPLIFPRHLTRPQPELVHAIEGLEVVWVESEQGPVEGWWLRAFGREERAGVVVFSHGNAELIEDWALALTRYREWGFHVFLPEFRGYGRSAGLPSQRAIEQDFMGFYDRIVDRAEVDEARVVFHGRSLGGGALCQLARYRPPAVLILESTFTSLSELTGAMWVPWVPFSDPFESAAVVEELDVPTLVLHGVHDMTVPFAHGEALARRSAQGRLVSFRSGHSERMGGDPERYWEVIEEFLGESGVSSSA